MAGDAISGEAAIDDAPGTNPPWTVAVGPQYSFKAVGARCFRALGLGIHQPQSLAGPVQDPNSVQYNPNSYTLPSTTFASLRAGVTLEKWQVSAFCDNLFDSRTTTNYAQVQVDAYNPNINQALPLGAAE